MHDTLTRPQIAPHIAIAARNVTLSLGEAGHQTQILKGIDLEIPLGQSVALLGPSGSGKSSLMAILSGLERASSGDVRVAGLDFGLGPEETKIWFGIIILVVVELGLITPPVGLNVFIINSLAPDVPMRETFKGVMPFFGSEIVRVLLLIAFPAISLLLPRLLQ